MMVQLGKLWPSLILQHGAAPGSVTENRVSRRGRASRYIRRYIRGTFGYIRVHSEQIRFCSTASPVGNHMKTHGFWKLQFQTSVHSPHAPRLFIIIKGRAGCAGRRRQSMVRRRQPMVIVVAARDIEFYHPAWALNRVSKIRRTFAPVCYRQGRKSPNFRSRSCAQAGAEPGKQAGMGCP